MPEILNGSISYAVDIEDPFDLGTIATYMCDDGFILVGDEERNCTVGVAGSAVGRWTGTQPTCVRKLHVYKLYKISNVQYNYIAVLQYNYIDTSHCFCICIMSMYTYSCGLHGST